ncbi:hypothetical protein CI109_102479 [Kwoniella shandongensis]|uniref:Uncharacterized protein n=1 Tax=Kwoniella shandongensis TaxID=1734106 RepID=A0A5M6BZT9_9TREE|nr:uncharacterized protein CI109_003202 [Kwoniella shandongensis]KAA5528304.1 hypothetical protein CI109_003202 [Kwoniella shandongensis]
MPYQPNHIFKGVVTKVGVMRKTATVTVERIFEHPKILKEIKRHKKYLVHDENEVARLEDKVTIIHGARTSRRKAFRLHSIVSRDTRKYPDEPIPSTIAEPSLKPRKERRRLDSVPAAKEESTQGQGQGQGGVLEALKDLKDSVVGLTR